MPQAAAASEKKEEKEMPKSFAAEGKTMAAAEVLLSKEARNEEFYFAPTKKGKAGKKAKSGGEDKPKPIKHNAETFTLFDKLKLYAPIYTSDIPALIEKLNAQMEEYQAKVKEWEQ